MRLTKDEEMFARELTNVLEMIVVDYYDGGNVHNKIRYDMLKGKNTYRKITYDMLKGK